MTYEVFKSEYGCIALPCDLRNEVFVPEQITAILFRKAKELCAINVKKMMEYVVIAVPQSFEEKQIQATRVAAELAELKVLKIISAPEAITRSLTSLKTNNNRKRFNIFVFINYTIG